MAILRLLSPLLLPCFLASASATRSAAFVAPHQRPRSPLVSSPSARTASLEAFRSKKTSSNASAAPGATAAAVLVGWTMAAQVAFAAAVPETATLAPTVVSASVVDYPTTIIAKGAYQPEAGFDFNDLSMPKYTAADEEVPKDISPAKQAKASAKVGKLQAAAARNAAKAEADAINAAAKSEADAANIAAKKEAAAAKLALRADVAAKKRVEQMAKMNDDQRAKAEAIEEKRVANAEKGEEQSLGNNMKRMYGIK